MTKEEILEWLDSEIQCYPERATGNECEDFIVRIVTPVVESDRNELIAAMREWINQRGKRTLMAIRIAVDHKLDELKPEIHRLLEDVRAGRAFSPYYEEFIGPALRHMEER